MARQVRAEKARIQQNLGRATKLAQMARAGASHRINYQESHEKVSLEGGLTAANVTW